MNKQTAKKPKKTFRKSQNKKLYTMEEMIAKIGGSYQLKDGKTFDDVLKMLKSYP